jgi:hypothetical protein
MQVSRIVAPFAVATMVAGAVPVLAPAYSVPVATVDIALTSAVDDPWTGDDLQAAFLATAVGNDPVLVDAVQTAVTTVVTGLNEGKTLTEALIDGSKHVDGHIGAELGRAIGASVGQIGKLVLIAPTVVRGSLTIATAVPGAFAPVGTALTVAFENVVAALGTAQQDAVLRASRHNVASALDDGLTSIAPVVQQVAEDISNALASERAKTAGNARTKNAAKKDSGAKRTPAGHSAGSARASGKRTAHSPGR